jgi:signal transduction histidine kinase
MRGDRRRSPLAGVGAGALGVAVSTLAIDPLEEVAPVDSLGVLYIPSVLLVSAVWGLPLGVLTALASALAYDYFYIPPVPSLGIAGRRNLVTLITFLVSAGLSALVAGLAARVRVAEENRRQAAEVRTRVLAAADEERRRVVRDMHDGAQQRLVHAMITLKLARDALRRDDPAAAGALVDESLEHTGTANTQLRELAQGIMPAVLTRGGLAAAIESLASRTPLPITVDVRTGRHDRTVESTAYFIVAEALTNVVKHAGASHAEVHVSHSGGLLRVEVADDGAGGARQDRGSGLLGLADRAASLDGELVVSDVPGGGTRIVAMLPLGAQAPERRR